MALRACHIWVDRDVSSQGLDFRKPGTIQGNEMIFNSIKRSRFNVVLRWVLEILLSLQQEAMSSRCFLLYILPNAEAVELHDGTWPRV